MKRIEVFLLLTNLTVFKVVWNPNKKKKIWTRVNSRTLPLSSLNALAMEFQIMNQKNLETLSVMREMLPMTKVREISLVFIVLFRNYGCR